ncbi:hypothetical protein CATMIT_01777, partial [Catenibacterium mitsuokai DSM 15897]
MIAEGEFVALARPPGQARRNHRAFDLLAVAEGVGILIGRGQAVQQRAVAIERAGEVAEQVALAVFV